MLEEVCKENVVLGLELPVMLRVCIVLVGGGGGGGLVGEAVAEGGVVDLGESVWEGWGGEPFVAGGDGSDEGPGCVGWTEASGGAVCFWRNLE